MSATSTRPSRPRISTIARRRSSLSTLFLKRQYSSRKLGIMIALSFYIACFRLSSVRESKVSRWRRALFCASGEERERRLGGGCQPLPHNTNSWRTTTTPLIRCAVFAGSKVLQAILRYASYSITKRRINKLTAAHVMSIWLVMGKSEQEFNLMLRAVADSTRPPSLHAVVGRGRCG